MNFYKHNTNVIKYIRKTERVNEYIMIKYQELVDGEPMDTILNLRGDFAVAGNELDQFAKELEELINKYRI